MSRYRSKSEEVRQKIWDLLKSGLASEEFNITDLEDIEFGFGYGFGESLDECIFQAAEEIWGNLEGFDDLNMDLGSYMDEYFEKKLDPVSELILTKFAPVDLEGKEIIKVDFASDDCYDGFRMYDGEPRHHFNVNIVFRSKNGRTGNGRAILAYTGVDKLLDEAIRDQFLTRDPDIDDMDDIVSKIFDWDAFEKRLSETASVVLASHMEEKMKKLQKRQKFSEELEAYQALQTKLKKAGII